MHRSITEVLAALCLLFCASCSALLDFNEEGLLCDALNPVSEGYSCLDTRAVRLKSVGLDGRCTQSEQCSGSMVCAPAGPHKETCRPSCDAYFSSTSACGSSEYCAVYPALKRTDTEVVVGLCVKASGCTEDSACGDGKACVEVNRSGDNLVKTCLPACSLVFTGTSLSIPNCVGSRTCQPVGVGEEKKLVCLENPNGTSGKGQGEPCDLGANVCRPGLGCVSSATGAVCQQYCNLQAPGCPSGTFCTPFNQVFAVCALR